MARLQLGFQLNHCNQVIQQHDQEHTALRMCIVLLDAECWDTGWTINKWSDCVGMPRRMIIAELHT